MQKHLKQGKGKKKLPAHLFWPSVAIWVEHVLCVAHPPEYTQFMEELKEIYLNSDEADDKHHRQKALIHLPDIKGIFEVLEKFDTKDIFEQLKLHSHEPVLP